ncbi:MAG: hypothetical protein NWE94_06725 [Candidatus Bathyarchaeota archaeon]|nr:hypothetical protein [Candidatus Bathyarchaeota archaeon]
MDVYTFIQQSNLYLQILFLALVFVSLGLKAQKKLRLHGITMLTAVMLHLISVIAVMMPSFISVLPLIAEGTTSTIYIIVLIHGILGILTTALAAWIVVAWRLRQSLEHCAPKKKLMRITLILWVLTVILAILLYVV